MAYKIRWFYGCYFCPYRRIGHCNKGKTSYIRHPYFLSLHLIKSPFLITFAMISVAISTLATNIAANIVSPANDFSNLMPDRVDFRRGGYITGVIGILIFPWKLIADPAGYIFTWLIGYSSLLGPIGGIMIVDYYFIRKRELDVAGLYSPAGRYWYSNGINRRAVAAFVMGVLPNVPGFLTATGIIPKDAVWPLVNGIYNYAWFGGFAVSGVIYAVLMRGEAAALNFQPSPAVIAAGE